MMCAAVPTSVFYAIILLLSLTIMSKTHLYTEGLPLNIRQERGYLEDEDILAGNEFLSVFLESSASYQHQIRREGAKNRKELLSTTTIPSSITTTTINNDKQPEVEEETHFVSEPYVRSTRKVIRKNDVPLLGTTEQYLINSDTNSDLSSNNNGVVIGVHVSSSVGSKIIISKNDSKSETVPPNFYNTNTNIYNVIAKSSNSKLNIDEPEPITINTENDDDHESSNFPLRSSSTSSTSLTSSTSSSSTSSQEHISLITPAGRSSLPPFHHSFIYHDNGEGADAKQPGKPRSVSYSTLIQTIPDNRKERNYNTAIYNNRNNYQKLTSIVTNPSTSGTKIPSSTTATPVTTTATGRSVFNHHLTTSKYPVLYGSPEKNYEIDESVSLVTNGRAHGIQQNNNNNKKKSEKDKKFGYVVEGRNYRQYRVEERTPDGFIVGEYGVVSHDDGSLRGVRYTADGTINPRLIQDALMKFLSL